MRGQVPGTTRNGERTKSAINNSQASGYRYVRAPEGVAQCRCLPNRSPDVSKHSASAGATPDFLFLNHRLICVLSDLAFII